MVNFSKQTLAVFFAAAVAVTNAAKPCYPLDGGETKCWDPTASESTCTVEGSSKEIPGCCPSNTDKGYKGDKLMSCTGGANTSNENLADANPVCYAIGGPNPMCFEPGSTLSTCTVEATGETTPACCQDGVTTGFKDGNPMKCETTGATTSDENLADAPEGSSAANLLAGSAVVAAMTGFVAMAI